MSNHTEQNMSDVGANVEILLVRMEGKIDRLSDRIARYESDHSALRVRVHELAGEVTPLMLLDLPSRIRVADQCRAEHDARISALEKIELQREGAAKLAKLLWAVMGAVGVGGIAAVIRLFQVGGF